MTAFHKIQAVVFDLSGVLTIEEELDDLDFPKKCGLSVEDWRRIGKEYFIEREGWDRVERGQLSLYEFSHTLSLLVGLHGGNCSPEMAATIWGDPDPFTASHGIREDVLDIIRHLHSSNTTALCTNNIREWRNIWQMMIPVSQLFDFVFDSSEVGLRKPQVEFWRHMESEMHLKAEDLLLVDDRMSNVEGARLHGWNAIQFTDSQSLLQDLSHYLQLHDVIYRDNFSFITRSETARNL